MGTFKVYITREIPGPGVDFLVKAGCAVEVNPHDRPLTREELLNAVRGVDGVIPLLTDRIDAEVFDAGKSVKGYANYAVGFDNLDIKEATKRNIPLSNTPGILTNATAEMAWALLFAVARRVVESDAVMRSGTWQGWGPLQFIGGDVTGKTLGIVGAGRIGTAMAMMSKGFAMRILYCDDMRNDIIEKELGAVKADLNSLLAESDYVSIHVPLLESTRHLFGEKAFSLMKPSSYLINTSRGPIVDENVLVKVLRERRIAGAGLDVYEFEPKMAAGLAALQNVVICPHTASATISSRTGMALVAAANLLAMMKGERAPNCINPSIYQA
jgi:glyoxylate reductase